MWRSKHKSFVPILSVSFILPLYLGCAQVDSNDSSAIFPSSTSVPDLPSPTPVTISEQNFRAEWKAKIGEIENRIRLEQGLWKKNELQSYSFVAAKYVGGVSSPWNRIPVLITVVDGQAISKELKDRKDASALSQTDGFEEFDTVEKLFAYMLRELDAGQIVTAEFDPKLHYPRRVWLSTSYESHATRSIEISRFTQ